MSLATAASGLPGTVLGEGARPVIIAGVKYMVLRADENVFYVRQVGLSSWPRPRSANPCLRCLSAASPLLRGGSVQQNLDQNAVCSMNPSSHQAKMCAGPELSSAHHSALKTVMIHGCCCWTAALDWSCRRCVHMRRLACMLGMRDVACLTRDTSSFLRIFSSGWKGTRWVAATSPCVSAPGCDLFCGAVRRVRMARASRRRTSVCYSACMATACSRATAT